MNNFKLVRNLADTSKLKWKKGSWLQFWKEYTKKDVSFCSVHGCFNTDLVGAHVANVPDNGVFGIIPVCNSCNLSGLGDYRISNDIYIAPIEPSEVYEEK